MIDFILDNPFIAILIIYGLISLFTGKKKKQQAAAKKAQANGSEAKPAKQSQVQSETSRNKIEDVLRNAIEQADREFTGTKLTSSASTTKSVTAGIGSTAKQGKSADDPFAFHSLMHVEEPSQETEDYDKTAVDYDVTAQDYDITGIDYDTKQDAFAFHSVTNKPAEKEYHLTSFTKFHSAHGLSAEDRRVIAQGEAATADGSSLGIDWNNPDDLRRAIIMQEVLGKPKARRS